uniref:Uncharacterized protein n=1 Tax=Parascaris univalens TaxID=6257 RepID=A0A915C1G8_PARUN
PIKGTAVKSRWSTNAVVKVKDLWRRMPSMCVYDGKYQNIGSVVSLGVRSERYLSLRERCDSISGGCNNWSVLRLLYHLV